MRVGDFDGDGRADLVGRRASDGLLRVARSTGSGFTNQDWGTFTSSRVAVQAVDLNQDGRTDLVGQFSGSSSWSVSLSTGSTFADQNWGTFFTPLTWQGGTVVDWGKPIRATVGAFNQVGNTVAVQLYAGLMKGGPATLETKAGNAWDQAAALVSLLGPTGVQTRFASATINVPIATAQQWLGATNPYAVVNLLTQAMLHATGFLDANGAVVSVQFDHAWVEAWLPGANGLQWTRLDPSWKFQDFQPGIPSIRTAVAFDETNFFAQLQPKLPCEYYQDQVAAYLHSQAVAGNLPAYSVADVPDRGPILANFTDRLPGAPAYTVVGTPTTYTSYTAVPVSLTHRVQVTLKKTDGTSQWSHLFVLPDMGQQRVTVRYVTQPNSLVKAELLQDGVVLAISGDLAATSTVQYVVEPLNAGETVIDTVHTQTYSRPASYPVAFIFDAGQLSAEALFQQQRALNQAVLDQAAGLSINSDHRIGAALALTGMRYFQQADQQADQIAALHHAYVLHPRVASGLVTSKPTDQPQADLQIPFVPDGVNVDFPNLAMLAFDLGGTGTTWQDLVLPATNRLLFYNASALESAVLEETFNKEAMSTAKGIAQAHVQGIPVLLIDSSNATAQLAVLRNETTDRLADSIIDAIEAKVNAGYRVTTPQRQVTRAGWKGAVYFAELFSATQAGFGAIIAPTEGNPLSGGDTTNRTSASPPVVAGAIPNATTAGDPVNIANGSLIRDETDVVLPNPGLPLLFQRHYNSQFTGDVGLGVGWVHSFSDFLTIGPNNQVT